MLVLSRRTNESILISEADGCGVACRVTVLEIQRGKVKLGFDAGGDVSIIRTEVIERLSSDLKSEI
jgi:carbon storage regulator CsrA